jgi:hypothetical protein
VVGIYEPTDLDGTYWVATGLLSSPLTFPAGQSVALYGDAVFTTEQGLIAAGPGFVDTTYQVVLSESVLADASGGGLTSGCTRPSSASAARGTRCARRPAAWLS